MVDRWHLVAPIAAFLIGLCTFPIVRRIALAVGFVDHPDNWRKLHDSPTALGGGIALWLATWSGWGLSRLGSGSSTWAPGDWFAVALAIASFVILVVGVIDDRYGMRARNKVVWQVVAAVILVGLGLRIDSLSAFGVEVKLGILAYPVAVCWLVLIVNAFNLVDGMDGFCGSLGLVAALAIAFLAYWSGRVGDAILALALAGALAAFLRNNLPPARIYLGDAGSMTLGLMIAALAGRTSSNGAAVSFPLVIALLTLPLLDVVTAIGRRWITGHPIFAPDRGHLHHCLKNRLGGNTGKALCVAIGLATLGAGGAVLAKVKGPGDFAACFAIVAAVGLLVGTNTFGRSELRLLLLKFAAILKPLLARAAARRARTSQAYETPGHSVLPAAWDTVLPEDM